MAPNPKNLHPGSYRDPSGFVFRREGKWHRQIHSSYREDYEMFLQSGLYKQLTDLSFLVAHEECSPDLSPLPEDCYKVIRPQEIPFITYPYEWCFSQFKDAALLTLEIQKIALEHGMVLKDASAFNIQFFEGKPIHIDTLSFEKYRKGTPWAAYKQFCEQFLAPLVLMSQRDVRLNRLFRPFLDGIPLDLTSSLLSRFSWLHPRILSHIHLHSRSQKRFGNQDLQGRRLYMSQFAFQALMEDLSGFVRGLKWQPPKSAWSHYYQEFNYSEEGFRIKKEFYLRILEKNKPKEVWDLGANTGVFSRLAAEKGISTIAIDSDPLCIEKLYRDTKANGPKELLPLVMDLTVPSPSVGWNLKERSSLIDRGPADMVVALALVHHLSIAHNVPFSHIAEFLSSIAKSLVIEFVGKQDSQVQRLLSSRADIFPDYKREEFEKKMTVHFRLLESFPIPNSHRVLYFMERR